MAILFRATCHRVGLLGSFFIVSGLLGISACDRQATPDWNSTGDGAKPPVVAVGESHVSTELEESEDASDVIDLPAASPSLRRTEGSGNLRFITYNVRNWLNMEPSSDHKPLSEKLAIIAILARHRPDVIGVCEIGTAEDLAEIQLLLKARGVDLPHSQFTSGSDLVRRLGLLSRFPITAVAKPAETEYKLLGKTFAIKRGILDVTIDANAHKYRFVGVHLKSKREVEDGSEDEMRRAEARLLRLHIDHIFERNPEERLIVYGDFNDTRSSVSGKEITGNRGSPGYLNSLPAHDSAGTRWTHFWSLHDLYSRIDFILVSRALQGEVDSDSARVLDDPEWAAASDHRAILAIFK